MTEQEAKELIKYINEEYFYYDKEGEFDEINEALDMAISALEEIQQYRAGTPEELREAREKQVPKKPNLSMNEKSGMFVDYADGHGEYKVQTNNWWRCPCCNSVVGQRVVAHKHVHDQRKKNIARVADKL